MKRKKLGRPAVSIYVMTQSEVAKELGTSRQRVAETEKRALAKVAAFILKQGSLITLLLGCSGPAFTGEHNEQGGDSSVAGEESGGHAETGGVSLQPQSGQTNRGGASAGSGLVAGNASQAGSSGAAALAGGPAMGTGGDGGAGGNPDLATCLTNHQNLACASVCDSQPTCQGILDCFVKTNSDLTKDCPGFNDNGYSLALEAERNCCQ